MDIGWPEILIILVLILLLFGPGRISKVAGELGKSVRNFKGGLTGEEEPKKDDDDASPANKK